MDDSKRLQYEQSIFSSMMLLSTQMETSLDRALASSGLTATQWFMSILLETAFNQPPTLKEAASRLGTSYQNIKQIALNLQKRGLVEVRKDPNDARITRLHLIPGQDNFWHEADEKGSAYLTALFNGISENDLMFTVKILQQIQKNMKSSDF